MPDLGWNAEQARTEDGNMQACIECAKANGYTAEQADKCDAGDLDCKGCPWGGKEEDVITGKIEIEKGKAQEAGVEIGKLINRSILKSVSYRTEVKK